jgi:hypothetical protein
MSPKFWEYFLNVEADLAVCSRYVAFSSENFNTYSNEFGKIIVVACAEIDAILVELCKLIAPHEKPQSINQYFPIIHSKFSTFNNAKVDIRRDRLNLQPWEEWTDAKSPSWWGNGYNRIKHDRTNHFQKANLHNALLAVGALFLVILYYHQHVTGGALHVDPNRGTQLFTPAKEAADKGGVYWYYGVD